MITISYDLTYLLIKNIPQQLTTINTHKLTSKDIKSH